MNSEKNYSQGESVAWRYKTRVYVQALGYVWREVIETDAPNLNEVAARDLTPLYTRADPGEVERLIAQCLERDARIAEMDRIGSARIQELSAQLAKRDALLVKANYIIDHARTIDKQAFGRGTQNVDPGLFRGLGNLLAQYDEALSASAEQGKTHE